MLGDLPRLTELELIFFEDLDYKFHFAISVCLAHEMAVSIEVSGNNFTDLQAMLLASLCRIQAEDIILLFTDHSMGVLKGICVANTEVLPSFFAECPPVRDSVVKHRLTILLNKVPHLPKIVELKRHFEFHRIAELSYKFLYHEVVLFRKQNFN